MPYSKLTLDELENNFELTFSETVGLFEKLPSIEPSSLLIEILRDNVPLAIAISTEKARSELIVAPILVALRKYFHNQISLFSGVDFNVDADKGLIGTCDFIISLSREQLFVKAPVVNLVEAKNDNLKLGLPQCLGEMLAAQIFNRRAGNEIKTIYGVVTTGTSWRFLSLVDQLVQIDLNEYVLKDLPQILGILGSFVSL